MTDYGRPVEFGFFLEPTAADAQATVAAGVLADRAGLDLLGIQDHPYQRRFLDTWTLLTAIGVQTERIRIFPDVANLPLRQPAVLAKAVTSLDLLTDGRVELGLGAGGFWDAIAAMGGPRRTPGESVRALSEAIDVLRRWWTGERSARVDGEFYHLRGVHPGPQPAHQVGIWLGAYGPKMLGLVGSKADGWLPSEPGMPAAKLAEAHARIDEAAVEAGRDPAAITRLYNIWDDRPTPAEWIERLTSLVVEHGMNGFLLGGPPTEQTFRTIADQIAPAVRENVAAARGATN
ncbi:LLM class flavin-dependent oxidoreductase [Nocardioides speluncae]|uniref:LLM class flavin-dependent oxidoreductase n=1 Tax=Nocardioides speluncae TaxID=2670337 RepID=UPI000D69A2BF|nr:LLM class flavin-dependent oxidoreductase [Nocardioides speluncae]